MFCFRNWWRDRCPHLSLRPCKWYMVSNVHQPMHLCMDVRNIGRLWIHSCFPFEEKNCFILQIIHGSQKLEFQLNSAINIVQSIATVVEQTRSKDPLLVSFLESMNRQNCVPVAKPFTPNLHILGKTIQVDMRADMFVRRWQVVLIHICMGGSVY